MTEDRTPSATALGRALSAVAPTTDRAIDRLAQAHDASHFLLTPQAVVTPRSTAEVDAVLGAAASNRVALTFRSGGTSLSGQSVTDGLLVDTRRHFRGLEVLEGGSACECSPGPPSAASMPGCNRS